MVFHSFGHLCEVSLSQHVASWSSMPSQMVLFQFEQSKIKGCQKLIGMLHFKKTLSTSFNIFLTPQNSMYFSGIWCATCNWLGLLNLASWVTWNSLLGCCVNRDTWCVMAYPSIELEEFCEDSDNIFSLFCFACCGYFLWKNRDHCYLVNHELCQVWDLVLQILFFKCRHSLCLFWKQFWGWGGDIVKI